MKRRPIRRLYILTITVLAILGVVLGFSYVLPLCLPFLFGYGIARLASPIVTFLNYRFRLPRGVGSLIIVFLFLYIFVTVIFFLCHTGLSQIVKFIENIDLYEAMFSRGIHSTCAFFEGVFHMEPNHLYFMVNDRIGNLSGYLKGNVMPKVSSQAWDAAMGIGRLLWNIITIFLSGLLFTKDFSEYRSDFTESPFYKEVHQVTGKLSEMGIAYLKAQFILLCITAGICTVGGFLIGNPYAILIGFGIGVFDAFPVLGSAFILIPWGVILLLKHEFAHGIIILVTYALCQLVRQILEPKLVGNGIGIRPAYTLISMYIGIKIYGTFGFLLGPISLVAIKAIVQAAMVQLGGREEKEAESSGRKN